MESCSIRHSHGIVRTRVSMFLFCIWALLAPAYAQAIRPVDGLGPADRSYDVTRALRWESFGDSRQISLDTKNSVRTQFGQIVEPDGGPAIRAQARAIHECRGSVLGRRFAVGSVDIWTEVTRLAGADRDGDASATLESARIVRRIGKSIYTRSGSVSEELLVPSPTTSAARISIRRSLAGIPVDLSLAVDARLDLQIRAAGRFRPIRPRMDGYPEWGSILTANCTTKLIVQGSGSVSPRNISPATAAALGISIRPSYRYRVTGGDVFVGATTEFDPYSLLTHFNLRALNHGYEMAVGGYSDFSAQTLLSANFFVTGSHRRLPWPCANHTVRASESLIDLPSDREFEVRQLLWEQGP